jgi:hypothetical protein
MKKRFAHYRPSQQLISAIADFVEAKERLAREPTNTRQPVAPAQEGTARPLGGQETAEPQSQRIRK